MLVLYRILSVGVGVHSGNNHLKLPPLSFSEAQDNISPLPRHKLLVNKIQCHQSKSVWNHDFTDINRHDGSDCNLNLR